MEGSGHLKLVEKPETDEPPDPPTLSPIASKVTEFSTRVRGLVYAGRGSIESAQKAASLALDVLNPAREDERKREEDLARLDGRLIIVGNIGHYTDQYEEQPDEKAVNSLAKDIVETSVAKLALHWGMIAAVEPFVTTPKDVKFLDKLSALIGDNLFKAYDIPSVIYKPQCVKTIGPAKHVSGFWEALHLVVSRFIDGDVSLRRFSDNEVLQTSIPQSQISLLGFMALVDQRGDPVVNSIPNRAVTPNTDAVLAML